MNRIFSFSILLLLSLTYPLNAMLEQQSTLNQKLMHLINELKIIYGALSHPQDSIKQLKKLVDDGADINSHNIHGDTPLTSTISYGPEGLMDALITLGADVNIESDDGLTETPLHKAVHRKSASRVKKLISAGANIEAGNRLKQTPIFFTINQLTEPHSNTEMDLETLRALIAAKANINAQDCSGITPLMLAAECNEKILKELLKSGAKIHVKENKGLDVLELSYIPKKSKEIIQESEREQKMAKVIEEHKNTQSYLHVLPAPLLPLIEKQLKNLDDIELSKQGTSLDAN